MFSGLSSTAKSFCSTTDLLTSVSVGELLALPDHTVGALLAAPFHCRVN